MKVIVSRSGGMAGIRLTWEVRVEEQPDPNTWAEFLNSLPWDDVTDSEATPDRFVYRIRCSPHEVVLAEPQVNGPWRDLVNRVRAANGM
ncbi:protealysin inhibitor emfourin [Cryobacterium aureum]|uniref:protealysin inhibitor emfourin n=1 Tax=Cryobacterium aureum TaxID=995037 RepID=UPI00101AED27|nr:protealysin inhibitor emfourin [Cryobacterium aureum]